MNRAGYLLVGGKSSRMGMDKALLQHGGSTIAELIAGSIEQVAGSVTLVGDPEIYGRLGFRVIADRRVGCGPLAGMEAALMDSRAEWNLIAACDMPGLPGELLTTLFNEAGDSVDCVIPAGPDGRVQPLCGVYRRDCLAVVSAQLDRGERKVMELLSHLKVRFHPVAQAEIFQNLNTPLDWNRWTNSIPTT